MAPILFYALYNLSDKIISNIKSIAIVKGGRWLATFISMAAGYIYAFVLMSADLDVEPWVQGIIMALCSGIAMFTVKTVEKKLEKTKLWEVKISVNKKYKEAIENYLLDNNIEYYYNEYGKHITFGLYCENKEETKKAVNLIKLYNGKYFVNESRIQFK